MLKLFSCFFLGTFKVAKPEQQFAFAYGPEKFKSDFDAAKNRNRGKDKKTFFNSKYC
jgi:hypothetical protein